MVAMLRVIAVITIVGCIIAGTATWPTKQTIDEKYATGAYKIVLEKNRTANQSLSIYFIFGGIISGILMLGFAELLNTNKKILEELKIVTRGSEHLQDTSSAQDTPDNANGEDEGLDGNTKINGKENKNNGREKRVEERVEEYRKKLIKQRFNKEV